MRQAQNEAIQKKCLEVQLEAEEFFRQNTSDYEYPVTIDQNLERML